MWPGTPRLSWLSGDLTSQYQKPAWKGQWLLACVLYPLTETAHRHPLNLSYRHVGLKASSEGPGVILKMVSAFRSQNRWEAPPWLICSHLSDYTKSGLLCSTSPALIECWSNGCLECWVLCRSESYLVTGPGSGTSSELGMSRSVLCVPWPTDHLVVDQQHPRQKGASPLPRSLSWLC